ncbi:MAG: hypothetical protein M3123_03920 [Actinomycetota bacterium]|nr:hypothetical protein [Actinomycetota bacterium]
MSARVTPILAVGVAIAGGLLAGLADAGGGVTITARPSIALAPQSPRYEPLVLTGSIPSPSAGTTVTVQANECSYPGWRDVTTTRTATGGRWQVAFDAASGMGLTKTTFRARWRRAVSRPVVVLARPGVELEQMKRMRWMVSLRALRSFLGRRGHLQRWDREASRWRTIKTFRFTEKLTLPPGAQTAAGVWSETTFRQRIARGTLVRVYVPRSQLRPCYLAAYSTIETVR